MGQIQWFVSLTLIALFSVAIIGFALSFGEDNDVAINLANDPEINTLYNQQTGNLSSFASSTENTQGSIIGSSIAEGGQTTATGGAFSLTVTEVIAFGKNTIKVGYVKIFGSENGFGIFMTSFLALITFITALLIWKTWAGRTPD